MIALVLVVVLATGTLPFEDDQGADCRHHTFVEGRCDTLTARWWCYPMVRGQFADPFQGSFKGERGAAFQIFAPAGTDTVEWWLVSTQVDKPAVETVNGLRFALYKGHGSCFKSVLVHKARH